MHHLRVFNGSAFKSCCGAGEDEPHNLECAELEETEAEHAAAIAAEQATITSVRCRSEGGLAHGTNPFGTPGVAQPERNRFAHMAMTWGPGWIGDIQAVGT